MRLDELGFKTLDDAFSLPDGLFDTDAGEAVTAVATRRDVLPTRLGLRLAGGPDWPTVWSFLNDAGLRNSRHVVRCSVNALFIARDAIVLREVNYWDFTAEVGRRTRHLRHLLNEDIGWITGLLAHGHLAHADGNLRRVYDDVTSQLRTMGFRP